MQFMKNEMRPLCAFANPLEIDNHNKIEGTIPLEGALLIFIAIIAFFYGDNCIFIVLYFDSREILETKTDNNPKRISSLAPAIQR